VRISTIAFNTFQHRNTAATLTGAGAVQFSGSEVKVCDNRDKTLFAFTCETRYPHQGATNAAAKEIIKRLLQLRSAPSKPNDQKNSELGLRGAPFRVDQSSLKSLSSDQLARRYRVFGSRGRTVLRKSSPPPAVSRSEYSSAASLDL